MTFSVNKSAFTPLLYLNALLQYLYISIILRSHEKGSWEPYWKELFTVQQGSVPKDWIVLVLADRGLYAPWLFKHIVSVGWHPFLRINLGGKVRPVGDEKWVWLWTLVPRTGTAWSGHVPRDTQRDEGRV
jgi:hypothetical protein